MTLQTILHVDLSTGKTWTDSVDSDLLSKLLGGRGVAAKLLYDLVPQGTDPLSPENVLIISAGTLSGTNAPTAGRLCVTTKGAQTGVYLKTSAGGHFAASVRMIGYDYLVFHGASEHPVYVWIDRNGVEIRNATSLWGRGIRETTCRLMAEGSAHVEVGCIGPAAENGVRFANIMFSYYCSASRCGAGAVMGSKRLKAVVVEPLGGAIHVAEPEAFLAEVGKARDAIYRDTLAKQLYDFGTAADVDFFNEMRSHPAYNFKRSYIDDTEGARRLSGRDWVPSGYLKRRRGCSGCIIACHRYTEVDEGPFAGAHSGGPQLETVNALGPRCGNTDVELVFKLNEMCNDLGLDVSTTGSSIAWLMETYERGLIGNDVLDGIVPTWGNREAMLELVNKIAARAGIGDLLGDGTREAAKRVGGESWKWLACGGKGLEITALELRAAFSYALAFAVNVRGADHLLTETIAEFGGTKEAIAVMDKITGDAKAYCGGSILEKRADIVRWHEDIYAISDALGICAFSTTATYGIDEERAARLFGTATGIHLTPEEAMMAGRRIVTLERCFNMREGMSRVNDRIPWRMMNEVQQDLDPSLDPIVTQKKLDTMLDEYYRLHGWDSETGNPTEQTLQLLGLDTLIRSP